MDKQEDMDKREIDSSSTELKNLTLAGWLLTLLSVTACIGSYIVFFGTSYLDHVPRGMEKKYFALVVTMIGVIPGMTIFGLGYCFLAFLNIRVFRQKDVLQMKSDLLERYYAALIYDDEKEYKEAIRFLTDHLSVNSSNAVAYNNRAVAYGEIGEFDLALADFKAAIRRAPQDADPVTNRGLLLQRMGELSRALSNFDLAVRIAPNDPHVRRIRGHARFAAGDVKGAEEDFEQAKRLERSD